MLKPYRIEANLGRLGFILVGSSQNDEKRADFRSYVLQNQWMALASYTKKAVLCISRYLSRLGFLGTTLVHSSERKGGALSPSDTSHRV
jgi:hypothetical protein